jgi:hypothetical protein
MQMKMRDASPFAPLLLDCGMKEQDVREALAFAASLAQGREVRLAS